MNTVLLSLLLVAAAANIILLVALLVRSSSNQGFAKEVREDLRVGREELRSSNQQAIQTIASGIRSFTEVGQALETRVKDLQLGTEAKLEATRLVLDRIRDTVDAKLDAVRTDLGAVALVLSPFVLLFCAAPTMVARLYTGDTALQAIMASLLPLSGAALGRRRRRRT